MELTFESCFEGDIAMSLFCIATPSEGSAVAVYSVASELHFNELGSARPSLGQDTVGTLVF